MARSDIARYEFRLPRSLNDRIEEVARGPGVFRSRIVAEALKAFLDRKGSSELELRFAERLDQISKRLDRIERNGRIELESLALFVRYMLMVSAPPAEEDQALRAAGRDRFAAFVESVKCQLAGGRLTLVPEDEDQ